MQQLHIKSNALRIAHQSELLELKKEVVSLKLMLSELINQRQMETFEVAPSKKIAIPTCEGLSLVSTDEIIYAKADGNYTELFTDNGKYVISKALKSVEKLIGHSSFIRCHQSYLVNKNSIAKVFERGQFLILSSGDQIPVSRRQKKEVLQKLSSGRATQMPEI